MADRDLAGPPPKEAVDYLRRKGVRAGYDYREVWREEHAHAFTIANMMKLDLLADVQRSLEKAQEEGKPAAKWKEEMAVELAKRGWWGRRPPPDPDDPKAVEAANLYVSRRLDTIWRVNTRQAAQAGVWERGQRSTSHPYVLYRVGPSKRHRDQHLAWDGLLLPKDAKFWRFANPMNGWGCKCYTRFVTKAQHRRYVDQGVPERTAGDRALGRKPVKTKEPVLREVTYYNERTKQTLPGIEGIDQGFEHNPGVGRMEQVKQQFALKDERLARTVSPAPGTASVADALNMRIGQELGRQVGGALDAIDRVHGVVGLPAIDVVRDRARVRTAGRLKRGPDGTPTEMSINAEARHPELTVAHEVGHLIDVSGLPGRDTQSELQQTEEMRRLLYAIWNSPTFMAIARHGTLGDDTQRYLQEPNEVFARAYSQWVAWRSRDHQMLAQLRYYLHSDYESERLRHWGYAEFAPIAEAMDDLFEEQGWLTRNE